MKSNFRRVIGILCIMCCLIVTPVLAAAVEGMYNNYYYKLTATMTTSTANAEMAYANDVYVGVATNIWVYHETQGSTTMSYYPMRNVIGTAVFAGGVSEGSRYEKNGSLWICH